MKYKNCMKMLKLYGFYSSLTLRKQQSASQQQRTTQGAESITLLSAIK